MLDRKVRDETVPIAKCLFCAVNRDAWKNQIELATSSVMKIVDIMS